MVLFKYLIIYTVVLALYNTYTVTITTNISTQSNFQSSTRSDLHNITFTKKSTKNYFVCIAFSLMVIMTGYYTEYSMQASCSQFTWLVRHASRFLVGSKPAGYLLLVFWSEKKIGERLLFGTVWSPNKSVSQSS